MPSKQQSDESSTSSSSQSKRPAPRSLIVSKVSLDKDEVSLYNDLSYNYPDVKKVSRNHDQNGNELRQSNSIELILNHQILLWIFWMKM